MRAWRPLRKHLRDLDAVHRRWSSTKSSRNGIAALLDGDAVDDAANVTVNGWVRSVRKQKKVAFAAIADGSTVTALQAVLKPEQAETLSTGVAVRLQGQWVKSPGGKQSHELQVSEVAVLGDNDAEGNPIQPKYQTPEFLRTVPHLRARTPGNALILRLRSAVIGSLTRFFGEQGFVQCHTPVITSSDCEGAGEVFTVSANPAKIPSNEKHQVEHFFKEPKYLTVSAQLHLEALSQAVDKVWTLSPTFRAEKSDTPRHLSEFYMLEAEQCFIEDPDRMMNVVENMLRAVATDLSASAVYRELQASKEAHHADEIDNAIDSATLRQRWEGLKAASWPRVTYDEAMKVLEEAHIPLSYDDGLAAEHERYLASHLGKGSPVFITHYPAVQKPFYMSRSPDDPSKAECFDLLVPDLCELAGGSMREHNTAALRKVMEAKGVKEGGLEWYMDLRKYGSVKHGGFGLGFDRLICYLSGVGNLRDVVAFPRWVGRCEC
ncbi:asparaginyl-tRNA synthetase [Oleoguttula sp. CCFEE 5521]